MPLLATVLLMVDAGEPVTKFSALPATDTIIVTHTSRGCFHRDERIFRFERSGNTLKVTAYDNDSGWFKGKNLREGKAIGTLLLSQPQLSRLNNLLDFYRGSRGDGCTTVEQVQIDQYRGSQLVGSEKFSDASCELDWTREEAKAIKRPYVDALSFRAIYYEIEKQRQGQRSSTK